MTPTETLPARAARLYPDSPYLQAEWLRAVRLVRSTSRGWLLDPPREPGKTVDLSVFRGRVRG